MPCFKKIIDQLQKYESGKNIQDNILKNCKNCRSVSQGVYIPENNTLTLEERLIRIYKKD